MGGPVAWVVDGWMGGVDGMKEGWMGIWWFGGWVEEEDWGMKESMT